MYGMYGLLVCMKCMFGVCMWCMYDTMVCIVLPTGMCTKIAHDTSVGCRLACHMGGVL